MFHIIFTVDYEIHGNGDGSPYDLMIEPTNRIINLFDKYGAKLTIMADVAEILKFREFYKNNGEDKFHYKEILDQFDVALSEGHDIQLHIHSGYFGSEYKNGKWKQTWDEYDLANLPYEKIHSRISDCKAFLENSIKPKYSDYNCNVFRAANWSMMPTYNISKALSENGIDIDTSVFKYGRRTGRVKFDYEDAYSELIPWFFNVNDICKKDNSGRVLEVPIYCENRPFWSFISFIRAYRMIRAQFHKHEKLIEDNTSNEFQSHDNSGKNKNIKSKLAKLASPFIHKHAWKLDFNQASGKQLINAVKRIEKSYTGLEFDIPIVLIGHSKSFIKYNSTSLKPFLKYISSKPEKFRFGIFKDLNTESYRL